MIKLFTIGFAGKSAERFFLLLKDAGVKKIIDTRLHPDSQLSGFAKSKDLKFFAAKIADIEYQHRPEFAPTSELLSRYRDKEISWKQYEAAYLQLLRDRKITETADIRQLQNGCLLCSEHDPNHCHRRLLAEYLAHRFDAISVHHLM